MTTRSNQIYTVGYQSLKKIDDLVELAREKQAAVADIRYRPWSSDDQWIGEEINKVFVREKLYGTYYWCRHLGNVNYRDKLPVKLWNSEGGVEMISNMLRFGPVILLCACWDLFSCHRLAAAQLLQERLGVEVEHIQAVPKEALPKVEKATPPPVLAAPWELVTPPFKPPSVSIEKYLRKIGAAMLPGFENVEVVKRKVG